MHCHRSTLPSGDIPPNSSGAPRHQEPRRLCAGTTVLTAAGLLAVRPCWLTLSHAFAHTVPSPWDIFPHCDQPSFTMQRGPPLLELSLKATLSQAPSPKPPRTLYGVDCAHLVI